MEPKLLKAYLIEHEVELYDCLHYLSEANDYYDWQILALNFLETDEHPLSMQWLREIQEGNNRLNMKAEDERSNYHYT